jgi:hypothetical protein
MDDALVHTVLALYGFFVVIAAIVTILGIIANRDNR